MDFNELYVTLILCGLLIKCRRVDVDFSRFKHNILKSHQFCWDFKNFKIHLKIPKNHHISSHDIKSQLNISIF